MIPSPRRTVSQPVVSSWDLEDDDGWQDMPVVRSDDNPFGLDEEDQKRYHYRPPARLDQSEASSGPSNATGAHLEVEADTLLTDSWRSKIEQDESDYTRLRLDEDEESEEVAMRTRYLFNEGKAMTPLSQMQATKELLTEGQRIAYVGLCQLVARRMLRDAARGWEGTKVKGKNKVEVPVVESAHIWMLKMMARLYQHMELEREEQRMIESLAEHGVDPSDLVPALMTTHTVKNPEFDPKAKEKADKAAEAGMDEEVSDTEAEAPPPYQAKSPAPTLQVSSDDDSAVPAEPPVAVPIPVSPRRPDPLLRRTSNPFGDEDDEDFFALPSSSTSTTKSLVRPSPNRLSSFDADDDDGDIGRSLSPSATTPSATTPTLQSRPQTPPTPTITRPAPVHDPQKEDILALDPTLEKASHDEAQEDSEEAATLPSLPGVSTSVTTADETLTLDIRWTVLCDLFLVLIADSVYDARSRVFLERVAVALGFSWLDVVRFENRVTDALEIQEGAEKTEQGEIIEGRRKGARRKRIAMMGLAAVGGGLVIGLSAGLLAPVIGAGLGAAFATVGISGTGTFLAGAGGAAVITTGGVLTGANIAGQGMARRTREVRKFEFRPLHNNKRVSCYITLGGFMASMVDDVRLPFSTIDPIVGDVFSVLWEPEMMAEMGGALKILTSEILTQVGQQVLAATVMTALLSALQWPIILTKLGYLIDNPWSNALDRSRAAGLVLADTIIQRHAGVRPISLIGFSLGARAIFYALVELARVKAYGLVQDVFLFGATVTASKQTWQEVRSAVSGRFVNGFATNDWMLGYLFRATSGGLNTVAGLRPVEVVPGLENIEVTDIITGHMSYRSLMPQLLKRTGFPVTADYFDEPDDPNQDMSVQERTIVTGAEEEAIRNQKRILGIFPRRDKGSRTVSGSTTPLPDSRNSSDQPGQKVDDYDDDDLPPREEADLGQMPTAAQSKDSILVEDATVKAIPKTAGFDFKAISKELGKDIDVDKLRLLDTKRVELARASTLERSGSAPPVSVQVPTLEGGRSGGDGPQMVRSASYAQPTAQEEQNDDDDEGDIASSSVRQISLSDVPSWERPFPLTPSKESLPSPPIKSPAYSFNAWSNPSSSTTSSSFFPQRSAPPARPHPPEFMANPFAAAVEDTSPGENGHAGWGKKGTDEQWAEKNPW